MRGKPERLQDAAIARKFEVVYDDIIERGIPGKLLPEFTEQAAEAAPNSILAASVLSHLVEIKENNQGANSDIAVINAKEAADTVIALDDFIKVETNKDDLVLYAEDRGSGGPRNDFLGVYLTVANNTWLGSFPYTPYQKETERYLVDFHIPFGVEATSIAFGKSHGPLQGTRNYSPDADPWTDHNRFRMAVAMTYPEISEGVFWRDNGHIPAVTIGQSAIMGLYEKMLTDDFDEGITEHRDRRSSYLLFRSAHFLGHAVAAYMREAAEKAAILPLWRQQAITELAHAALASLDIGPDEWKQQLRINRLEAMAFWPDDADERQWLNVKRPDVLNTALTHAYARGMSIEAKTVDGALDTVFKN